MEQMDILTMEQILKGLNIVLLGKTGVGKSSSGNTILGRLAFKSKKSSKSVTQSLAVKSGKVGPIPVNVYDTPGLFDTDMNESEIQQKLQTVLLECESGPCVYLLVIKTERFTKEERETVKKIEKLLGKERLEKTWILFTRGDELEDENMTIEEFINDTEPLKKLVEKYDRRYHVFNNKRKENTGQVQKLFTKILNSCLHVFSDGEVLETLKQNPLRRKIPQDTLQDTPVSNLSSTRIVLLGKSGVGKSAAGNTILGQKEFISLTRMNSVTSESSVKQNSDRSVSVVDTPGLFDTNMTQEHFMIEIMRSVYISSPGPHAFLIVLSLNNRFTEQEQIIPHMIEMMFGEGVLKYCIILFTHGDQLKTQNIEKLIQESSTLRHLVNQCGGRYHVFNNRDHNNREQVNVLLQKIDKMIEENGGRHYSNEMFEDALRFRQEEEEQRQREEEEIKQQEEKQRLDEEKRREEEIDRVRKETEEKTRAECEAKMNSELKTFREEKQKQEEIERVRKETEEKTRAENEAKRKSELKLVKSETEKPNNRFNQFLSKYWKHILIVLLVGGVTGVGVGICVGIKVGVGTGVGVGIGTGIASSCIAAGAACAYEKYKQ